MIANNDRDPLVKKDLVLGMAQAYLSGQDPRTPLAAPLHADLHGLPPLLIQVGTSETLLDDARRLAVRAKAAGVETTIQTARHDPRLALVWLVPPRGSGSQRSNRRIREGADRSGSRRRIAHAPRRTFRLHDGQYGQHVTPLAVDGVGRCAPVSARMIGVFAGEAGLLAWERGPHCSDTLLDSLSLASGRTDTASLQ